MLGTIELTRTVGRDPFDEEDEEVMFFVNTFVPVSTFLMFLAVTPNKVFDFFFISTDC